MPQNQILKNPRLACAGLRVFCYTYQTMEEYIQEIRAIYRSYEKTGTKPWDYGIASRDLSYQVGSLTKLIMQMEGERYKDVSDESLKEKIGDELADIFAEVLFISSELDIDIDKSWRKMVDSDNRKIEERK